jgi:hypothetical protein
MNPVATGIQERHVRVITTRDGRGARIVEAVF